MYTEWHRYRNGTLDLFDQLLSNNNHFEIATQLGLQPKVSQIEPSMMESFGDIFVATAQCVHQQRDHRDHCRLFVPGTSHIHKPLSLVCSSSILFNSHRVASSRVESG